MLTTALTVPALVVALRRTPPGRRAPVWLLILAMCVLSVGVGIVALGDRDWQTIAEVCDPAGHTLLLAAAVALVLRRGGNAIGGMLDMSVAAIALCGLLWTSLLSPRLQELHSAPGDQLTMLVTVLVLGGVLGALMRLWFLDRRLPALRWLVLALLTSLVGNVVLAWAGTVTGGRSGDVDMFLMVSYICLGLAALHPSAPDMLRPGPAPADTLSNGRLVFMGLALVAGPLSGGLRSLAGLSADGPLLATGSVLVTSLVMIRMGRLARQRQDAEQRLRYQATHDLLTGLPNRAELLARLAAALDREASGPPSVVLLFCDLNGFKQVNDRLGHEAGDQLLTGVAERIRVGMRSGDTLARYGGDEFLLLSFEPAQEAAVARLTEHVRQALVAPFRLAGEPVTISASVGAAVSDADQDADELISRADQSMYQAKRRHRAERVAALEFAGGSGRGTP